MFVFVFEDRFRSFANDLYLSLLGKSNPGTFPGFESVFKVSFGIENVKQVRLIGCERENLNLAIEAVNGYKIQQKKIIAIYIEDYDFDTNGEASSTYYYLKYNFVRNDIPLQVINYRKLGDKNSLKWSTSNIALAIFSKLGGIPWLVKPSKKNCLILGIGSAHKYNDQTKEVIKYFAYTVCLDSSGLYKSLEVLAEEEDKHNYLDKLKENIVALLNTEQFNNYQSCVLHLPFKIKREEINALTQALTDIKHIEFVVIKVNTDNKFFGYSSHNTYVPYESDFIRLSSNQYLVWFEGLQLGKEVVDKRLSNPVHIQFLNSNNLSNIEERDYLQDVLNLSGANWRGFNAKSIPISIYYSQIIANYIKSFEDLAGYNESSLSNERPWFL
jgi:hypothetical protein